MNLDLLKGIANSDYRNNLVAYLKGVQNYVADIRNGDFSNETRKATVDVIEKMILSKLNMLSDRPESNSDSYK
jgi:hypothetical protein